MIKPSLHAGIEYASDGAVRWFPLGKRKTIVFYPALQFGTPAVSGTGVPTDTIYASYLAEGRDKEMVGRVFNLTAKMVNGLPGHLARGIRELSTITPGVEQVIYFTDGFARDAPDLAWIGDLSKNGPWSIVSIDRFKKQHGAEREAIRRAGHTVFILDAPWSKQGFRYSPSVRSGGGRRSLFSRCS